MIPNFDTLSSASLVAIHNSLTALVLEGDVPAIVKKFSDKKTAVKRVSALLERVSAQQFAAGAPPVLIEGDVARIAPAEPTAAPSDADSHSRLMGGLDSALKHAQGNPSEGTLVHTPETLDHQTETKDETKTAEPSATVTREPPAAATTRKTKDEKPATKNVGGRPSAVGDTDVIRLLHTGDNPKRGMAAARFSQYRTGMTVAEYAEAISPDYPRDPRRQALRDILWDMKQNWISVVGAKQAKREAAAETPEKPAEKAEEPARQLWPSELAREGKVYNYARDQKVGWEGDYYNADGTKTWGSVVDNNGVTVVYEDSEGSQTALEIIDEKQRTLADL